MNINTAADRMRVALNEAHAEINAAPDSPQRTRVLGIIAAALTDYNTATSVSLIVSVQGRYNALLLCGLLDGENLAQYGGQWWAFNTVNDPHHVRELMREWGMRGTVEGLS